MVVAELRTKSPDFPRIGAGISRFVLAIVAEWTISARHKKLFAIRKIGAGEGIRTLDPNLGKVVLYP